MSTIQAMKRIPRIKFPQRHGPKASGSLAVTDQKAEIPQFGWTAQQKAPQASPNARSYRFSSEVPAPPTNTSLGGKASMLPKRTPLSESEIEAILKSKGGILRSPVAGGFKPIRAARGSSVSGLVMQTGK